ncbi:MAG TPA: NAD-binding protein, partial [Polyangiaceae bacterium]
MTRITVGVPKELKEHEYRVGLLPIGVEELSRQGHRVFVERGAGLGSGISDAEYERYGAVLTDDPREIYALAELIVKVKEPQPQELCLLRSGQLLFGYFHFAASETMTRGVLESGATAIAYETLQDRAGLLPLLTPMSEVAGRMSVQQGAKYLERPHGGRGILLGGVPGVEPAHVTVLGGGVVGSNAAKIAAGIGAKVSLLDTNLERLRYLDDVMPDNVSTLFSDRHTIKEQLTKADLVIGAVLIRGARAPALVT